MTGANEAKAVRTLAVAIAVFNFLSWFAIPAIRTLVDETTGRWSNPDNPRIMTGVQELLVYFDPWLACGVFPVVYTLGLAVIPFLYRPGAEKAGSQGGVIYTLIVSFILTGFELVWLFLVAVGVFFRGPNWTFFWPGEQWDEHKVVPLNHSNLSDLFWCGGMGRYTEGMPWALRELPGLVLAGGYILAGLAFAWGLFRVTRRAASYWRWTILVLVVQIAALVPLKMACRWLFNVKYWVFVPEHFGNV